MPKVSKEYKEKQKESIIRAAAINFGRYGYANTKMDDIAIKANVGKGTLYEYFPSKEELFQEICRFGQKFVTQEMSQLFQDKNKVASDLGRFFDNQYSLMQDGLNFRVEALAEVAHNPKIKRILHQNRIEILTIIINLLKQMKRKGFFKKEIDLKVLASGMEAVFAGVYLSRIVGETHEEARKVWVKTMLELMN